MASRSFIDEAHLLMGKGDLVLLNEPNGLHLRWLCLSSDETVLYWMNPKNDVLQVPESHQIQIDEITHLIISRPTDFDDDVENQDVLKNSSLPYAITILTHDKEILFCCPMKRTFDLWQAGLISLVDPSKVKIDTSGDPNDPKPTGIELIHNAVLEYSQLINSLFPEVQVLMDIRTKRDRVIHHLLQRLENPEDDIQRPILNDASSEITSLQKTLNQQHNIIEELTADRTTIEALRQDLELKLQDIDRLKQSINHISSERPPETSHRSDRRPRTARPISHEGEYPPSRVGFRRSSTSSTDYEEDPELSDDSNSSELSYLPSIGSGDYDDSRGRRRGSLPFGVRGRHISTPLLRNRELKMERQYVSDAERRERLGKLHNIYQFMDVFEERLGQDLSSDDNIRLFRLYQEAYYPELDDYEQLADDLRYQRRLHEEQLDSTPDDDDADVDDYYSGRRSAVQFGYQKQPRPVSRKRSQSSRSRPSSRSSNRDYAVISQKQYSAIKNRAKPFDRPLSRRSYRDDRDELSSRVSERWEERFGPSYYDESDGVSSD
ncbi:hypothetical protein BLNAU_6798 [Blattamonas nauphoetae]|uniref:PH domain-containing protein n=1 Tax=Blattamonas nauphoetae TaxID=2049346 RepID=A0ABQ9Y3K1_9EUKA|nr:hypothetical protein BLNAU_6798 [Blattamonas nauphoetae]